MKTIIILESDNIEQESVAEILRQSPVEYNLLFAQGEQAAIVIARQETPHLIIYDISSMHSPQLEKLDRLTYELPYIPCLTIITEDGKYAEAVRKAGVTRCLSRPLDDHDLLRACEDLTELSTSGQIRGIPLHSLLQMLESDKKTCTLKVRNQTGESGLIFMDKGVIIAAEASDLQRENAVYTIITWEEPKVEIRYYNSKREQEIDKPLISLIMEGFRLKDELESRKGNKEVKEKQKIELKHVSTASNRISLDIGSKIKLEFDDVETSLVSTTVGMIPDDYIIATTPSPLSIAQTVLAPGNGIIVKYLHMGKLCMFKSRIIKAITDPHQLLFLTYPLVIHYHELRKAKRTAIFIPCTLHLSKGPEYYGVLVDLSGLGCLCQIKAKGNAPLPGISLDATIKLRCLLPGLKEDQELNGIVRNVKRSASEMRIGIEFYNLQDYLRETIERYIYAVESISG